MSEIKVGDLFVVVHGHCSKSPHTGKIFTAQKPPIKSWSGYFDCSGCGATFPCEELLYRHSDGWFPRSWLKRIPPLEELDDVKRDETIEA